MVIMIPISTYFNTHLSQASLKSFQSHGVLQCAASFVLVHQAPVLYSTGSIFEEDVLENAGTVTSKL